MEFETLSQSPNRASVFNGVLRKKTISCCEIISFMVRMSQDSSERRKRKSELRGNSTGAPAQRTSHPSP